MSNWKHAYGWMGHIITSKGESKSTAKHNVVAIPNVVWERLVTDYENCTLDERIECNQLGVSSGEVYYLACGYAFSEGFEHYGTVFEEAEMLEGGNETVSRKDQEKPYLDAFLERYAVKLPPCKLMVGCASEH